MPDREREKVVSAIEVLDDFFGDDNKIHTVSPSEAWGTIRELLKEQENASKRNPVIVCPHCGKRVK